MLNFPVLILKIEEKTRYFQQFKSSIFSLKAESDQHFFKIVSSLYTSIARLVTILRVSTIIFGLRFSLRLEKLLRMRE